MHDLNLIFCIEATARMQPHSKELAEFTARVASRAAENLKMDDILTEKSDIRFSFLLFRNCKCDGDRALELWGLFHFPDEESQFQEALQGIEYIGDGRHVDPRSSGLEAIWDASYMLNNYRWEAPHNRYKVRDGIIVLANSRTNPLGHNTEWSCLGDTPATFDDLKKKWNEFITNGLVVGG